MEYGIDIATSGDNILVPASSDSGRPRRLYWLWFVASGDVTVRYRDGIGGSWLTGPVPVTANGSVVFDHSQQPWFTTSPGKPLVINLSGDVQISGRLGYE